MGQDSNVLAASNDTVRDISKLTLQASAKIL